MFLACLNPPIRRAPPEIVGVNSQAGFPVLCTLHVFFHQLGGDTDHMLALPVFDHVEGLQRTNDVFLGDAGHCTIVGIIQLYVNRLDTSGHPVMFA